MVRADGNDQERRERRNREDSEDDTRGAGHGGDGEGGGEFWAGGPDARLADLLRGAPATAYPALRALRARHHPALLAYARLCTTGEPAARQLAAQTFTLAARETARGNDPDGPWRHRLLLLAGRVAADWAADDRAGGLDAGLLLVLNTAAPGGPLPPLLTAFRSLPSRTQGLLWYGVVEREPAGRTAALLGLTPEDVGHETGLALHALAQAALRLRLAASDDPRCDGFRRLIEESVRPDTPRHSPDLDAHRAHCPCCTTAYEEQCALRDTPRAALAEGLLPWGGTAYAREQRMPGRTGHTARGAGRPGSRRLVLASTALGVALVPVLVLLMSSEDPSERGSAGAVVTGLPSVPAVTVTATATVPAPTPTPTPTPSPSRPSPSPTRPSSPPRTTPPPPPRATPSPARPPGALYAQVVNVSTGRCLDVADDFDNGTDVVTVPCSSSPGQRWRVDSGRGVIQSYADPDFCLDSRGSVDKGIGVWRCSSVDGRNGQNLKFVVGGDGTIRPAIAIATAITAEGDGGVFLEPSDGRSAQRWRAGAT